MLFATGAVYNRAKSCYTACSMNDTTEGYCSLYLKLKKKFTLKSKEYGTPLAYVLHIKVGELSFHLPASLSSPFLPFLHAHTYSHGGIDRLPVEIGWLGVSLSAESGTSTLLVIASAAIRGKGWAS